MMDREETQREFQKMIEGIVAGNSPQSQKSKAEQAISIIVAILLRTFAAGGVILGLSTVLIEVYPSWTWLQPGIGFWEAIAAWLLARLLYIVSTSRNAANS